MAGELNLRILCTSRFVWCAKMLKLTCFCVLTLFAGVLADNHEVACCPPGLYVSLAKVEGKATCFAPWRNDTELAILQCDGGFVQTDYSNFTFKEDGTVIAVFHNFIINITTDGYCVNEMIASDNFTAKYGFVCNESKIKEYQINGYILIVSVLFLIITVVIYAVLKELRDLLGISYINLCSSLAIGLCLLASIILKIEKGSDQALCAVRGFLAYFFLLVSFFWTTAISTQLLINIRSPSFVAGRKWKTFGWYALFAWGCPLIMTISMAIVNYHPGDHSKPDIGISSCWFEQDVHIWSWLYSVLAILISANIVMFVYVSFFLCRNTFASSQAEMIKYKFFMSLKLFVVMGLFWIIELIQSLLERNHVIMTIFNIISCLQGVWIFLVIVVFRKRVIRGLHKRGWLACISGPVEKHLANGDDVDDEFIEHTSVPMNDH